MGPKKEVEFFNLVVKLSQHPELNENILYEVHRILTHGWMCSTNWVEGHVARGFEDFYQDLLRSSQDLSLKVLVQALEGPIVFLDTEKATRKDLSLAMCSLHLLMMPK